MRWPDWGAEAGQSVRFIRRAGSTEEFTHEIYITDLPKIKNTSNPVIEE